MDFSLHISDYVVWCNIHTRSDGDVILSTILTAAAAAMLEAYDVAAL